jgi:hypothetical protein
MTDGLRCSHCNAPICKLQDYLLVENIITPYCDAVACQQSKGQQARWYAAYGLRVREGKGDT